MIPKYQLILDIRPDAPPRFDNFLLGDNLEAATALYLAADSTGGEAVIYCWGEVGSGRSHLLQAAVAHAKAQGREAHYCTTQLPEDLPAFLAVDGVDGLDGEAQIALFSLINRAREGGGTLIVAGDQPPAGLRVREDLSTRLGAGLVFQMHPLSTEQRTEAVRERGVARGMRIEDEVVRYLITHSRRDLSSLLATLDALDELSLSRKRPVTLPLLRDLLSQTTQQP
jgi:DnaA-homolog protein